MFLNYAINFIIYTQITICSNPLKLIINFDKMIKLIFALIIHSITSLIKCTYNSMMLKHLMRSQCGRFPCGETQQLLHQEFPPHRARKKEAIEIVLIILTFFRSNYSHRTLFSFSK